jgi:hypothetical protein
MWLKIQSGAGAGKQILVRDGGTLDMGQLCARHDVYGGIKS